MVKKIDINIKPRKTIKIPNNIPYKEWIITIKMIEKDFYHFEACRTKILEDNCFRVGCNFKGNNLRKHLSSFKNFLDEIRNKMTSFNKL